MRRNDSRGEGERKKERTNSRERESGEKKDIGGERGEREEAKG